MFLCYSVVFFCAQSIILFSVAIWATCIYIFWYSKPSCTPWYKMTTCTFQRNLFITKYTLMFISLPNLFFDFFWYFCRFGLFMFSTLLPYLSASVLFSASFLVSGTDKNYYLNQLLPSKHPPSFLFVFLPPQPIDTNFYK